MAKTIEELSEEYTDIKMSIIITVGEDDDNSIAEYIQEACKYGANAVLKEVESELNRAFLNDYNEMSEQDRNIAQGVIGQIKIFVEQLKGK